jgi:Asp-tRNA(Asn)/Glu-tRNA(Gln) amidotransferase C subunit
MARDNNLITSINELITSVLAFDKQQLIKRPEWGSMNFEEASPDIEGIFQIIGYLNVLPYDQVPDKDLQEIQQAINNVINLFNKINSFSLDNGNPASQKQQLSTSAHTAAVKDAESELSKAKKDVAARQTEIQEIISKAREASASAGAAVFTRDFFKESANFNKSANKWLTASIILTIITFVIAILFWIYVGSTNNQPEVIWQRIVTKVFILGLFVSATFWCGKIYRALMHQSSVYKHKALSIQTLQAFSASAADSGTKDAVLLEAARAVFGNVPTGYIDGNSSGEAEIKVFDLAKKLIPPQK